MDLFDDRAVESDDADESFDEDTGEVRRKEKEGSRDRFDDSSEEEDDEEDEEAAAEVAEGFIVDEEDEDEETRRERRRERKKRRREEREREEEGLDEEDLELIGLKPVEDISEPKFKRLKRGPREDRDGQAISGGVDDIFRESDEEEEAADYRRQSRSGRRGLQDEFEDFIEEDVFSDEEQQRQEDEEVARPRPKVGLGDFGVADAAGLDQQALEDFRAAFGDGTEYDFALEKELDAEEEQADRDKHLDLKDVFEPSQLEEKMLTDEDNLIRATDEPERHQLARKPYRHVELTDDQLKEESGWISKFMLPKKSLTSDLHEPFRKAVAQVIEFLVRDDLEVAFIFQNRKDYLIHAVHRQVGRNDDRVEVDAKKLLNQADLWEIFDWDLKFRALIEKRNALQTTYDSLRGQGVSVDPTFEEMLPKAETMEELQDLQDYLHFQYTSQLKDIVLTANGETNGTIMSRKKASTQTLYEQIRNGRVYGLVRAYGITADAFARNVLKIGVRTYTEDPSESPDALADSFLDEEFTTSSKAVKAAKVMFVEELATSPRLRKYVRENVYITGVIDCERTEKGLRRIDEAHPYYEFKYLRNQEIGDMIHNPALFLKMLKAEEEGLVDIKVRLSNADSIKRQLAKQIETDNYSSVADAWNAERRNAVGAALDKIMKIMERLVKENIKNNCESSIAGMVREEISRKLDQAPYAPRGMKKGTVPRVLALSNGNGMPGREAISWAYVSEDGRVMENGKYTDLAPGDRERGLPDTADVPAFLDVVRRRAPDAIAVSGYSPETRKLLINLQTLVKNHNLRGPTYVDDDDRDRSDLLEVVIVNDEIARLYQSSERAKQDHPGLSPLTLYCVALAKYMQDPMKEYAGLGRDLVSISFHHYQHLLPQDKVLKQLEAALVDFVSMTGVDINEAITDVSLANLLQYVPGLGPRKASQLLKVCNLNGGYVNTREDLLGVNEYHPAMGLKVWTNAASFLYISYDPAERDSEYLDNTRIHPEDYDIARKMAADALELDEEDIAAEISDHGRGAIVRKLIKEEAQDKVNDLVLEEYAEQLEKNLNQRKRATLENIRAEIIEPYEELRQPFISKLSRDDLFTMLTGETRDTLDRGMNVSVSVKKVFEHGIEGKLDCGLDVFVPEGQLSDRTDVSARQLFTPHQAIQAHILNVDHENFTVTVSLRDEYVKKPYRRFDSTKRGYNEWDDRQEANDRKLLESKTESGGLRAGRVIKHPLFRPFNAKQAEEYLGNHNRGDVVIRPSSKGTDHLAVTWKVADGVYQHIDVLELDKENEFSLGKTLRIGGRYTYSDLDELIVAHVKAMAKKVDEMMGNEKYLDRSKAAVDEWLTTYTAANPKRSMYMFCLNRERPGQFHLCFKAGQKAKLMDWAVRVIPQGFELMKQPYPTMRDLCNGFKLIFSNMQSAGAALGGRGGGIGTGGGNYGGGYGARR